MVEGKKVVKYFLKALIYFGLFFVFCYFYMVDQMNDFIRGRRTVSSRFEEAEVLEPPSQSPSNLLKFIDFVSTHEKFLGDINTTSIWEMWIGPNTLLREFNLSSLPPLHPKEQTIMFMGLLITLKLKIRVK